MTRPRSRDGRQVRWTECRGDVLEVLNAGDSVARSDTDPPGDVAATLEGGSVAT